MSHEAGRHGSSWLPRREALPRVDERVRAAAAVEVESKNVVMVAAETELSEARLWRIRRAIRAPRPREALVVLRHYIQPARKR
jgi:hypothetical protein